VEEIAGFSNKDNKNTSSNANLLVGILKKQIY
jgi:hypothetical protein